MNKLLICYILLCSPIILFSQTNYDQSTVEGTTSALLDIISGDIGEKRDWDGFRSLFIPTAQFVFVNEDAPPNKRTTSYNLEQFVRFVGPNYAQNGFKEVATGLVVNEWNGIASAFQSYTAKNLTGTYNESGINNYQLVKVKGKWFVTSLTWANADEANPIPKVFLR